MNQRKSQTTFGLTLLELVVVMAILAALAGIVVPLLPSMITRAHTSTAVTNGAELTKIVQTFQAMHLTHPDILDDLGGGTGTPVSIVPGNGSADYTTVTLSDGTGSGTVNTLATLQSAGIKNVLPLTTAAGTGQTNWSPTFFPYAAPATGSTPTATALASGTKLVGITADAAVRNFGLGNLTTGSGAKAQFVVFGVGRYTTMAGNAMQEAPVHFDDSAGGNPSLVYARFGLVFQLTDNSGNALDSAKFLGTVEFMSGGAMGIADHLQEYYQTSAQ